MVEQVILNIRKYIGVYIRNLEKDLDKCKMDKGEVPKRFCNEKFSVHPEFPMAPFHSLLYKCA